MSATTPDRTRSVPLHEPRTGVDASPSTQSSTPMGRGSRDLFANERARQFCSPLFVGLDRIPRSQSERLLTAAVVKKLRTPSSPGSEDSEPGNHLVSVAFLVPYLLEFLNAVDGLYVLVALKELGVPPLDVVPGLLSAGLPGGKKTRLFGDEISIFDNYDHADDHYSRLPLPEAALEDARNASPVLPLTSYQTTLLPLFPRLPLLLNLHVTNESLRHELGEIIAGLMATNLVRLRVGGAGFIDVSDEPGGPGWAETRVDAARRRRGNDLVLQVANSVAVLFAEDDHQHGARAHPSSTSRITSKGNSEKFARPAEPRLSSSVLRKSFASSPAMSVYSRKREQNVEAASRGIIRAAMLESIGPNDEIGPLAIYYPGAAGQEHDFTAGSSPGTSTQCANSQPPLPGGAVSHLPASSSPADSLPRGRVGSVGGNDSLDSSDVDEGPPGSVVSVTAGGGSSAVADSAMANWASDEGGAFVYDRLRLNSRFEYGCAAFSDDEDAELDSSAVYRTVLDRSAHGHGAGTSSSCFQESLRAEQI